jgi:hypothetical protein
MDTPRTGPTTLLRNLGWDIGVPVVTYYALHFLGASDWMALLAGSLAAGVRIVWPALRDRTLNLFAAVMLGTFLIGLALAFVSGDPRFLLLKGSVVTGSIALGFLVSTALGRPLTLAASQAWNPDHAAAIAAEHRTDPRVRRGHRTCSLVWGFGLLAEALIRIPLIYLLPISVMVGLSTVLMVAAFVLLTGWTVGYLRRHRSTAAESVAA